jgi:predicted dehydrogenase
LATVNEFLLVFMKKINWGIIGCGDVTEIKSGPAFNKVKNSSLVAVMRRDANKAKDYAFRHHVPKWYADASGLINDPDVNAIYIATPPSSHEEYAIAAISAGKPVYVEKPMTMSFASANKMAKAAKEKNIKLSVAHYRREIPLFKKIKTLLDEKLIGDIRFIKLELYKKPVSNEELNIPMRAWRVDTAVAGGGLFHDLAPHQLDLMYYFFGETEKASGIAVNQGRLYSADDMVTGNILFRNGAVFSGTWCFNVAAADEKDNCEIFGSNGKISFSVFEMKNIIVSVNGKTDILSFEGLQHVQQPMIEKVVEYFLDKGPNPCSADEGAEVMRVMDQFTTK